MQRLASLVARCYAMFAFPTMLAAPAAAAPDLAKYSAPPIELKGLPYELSLRSPSWRIKTLDGGTQVARLEVFSGKSSSLYVNAQAGWVQIVNRAPPGIEPWGDFGPDGYAKLVVAPLTNLKGRLHRLSCTVTGAKQPLVFAILGEAKTVKTVAPENGIYHYEFATQSGQTPVLLRPATNSSVFFYGCRVSVAPLT